MYVITEIACSGKEHVQQGWGKDWKNLLISTSTLAERNQWRNSATSLDAVILGTCVAVEPENAEEVQEWMGPRSDQNLFFGHFYGDHWMCARIFNEEWMCRWWDDWIWLQRALSKPPPCSRIYHMWFLEFLWIRLRICYAACNSMWNFCVHSEEMLQERFVYNVTVHCSFCSVVVMQLLIMQTCMAMGLDYIQCFWLWREYYCLAWLICLTCCTFCVQEMDIW